MNDFWDIVFTQQPGQEGVRGLDLSVARKKDALHQAVLVHCPPSPVSDAIHRRAGINQMPAGTPAGFPLTQFFSEQRPEVHAPFAQCFVADLLGRAGEAIPARHGH
ncbi:hypothetical protein E7T06_10580 [Deinococcus sp. Arct2-2]|nr:hypothetical protein E7T06_10580 [Deinococcus sp. Arct2-2]